MLVNGLKKDQLIWILSFLLFVGKAFLFFLNKHSFANKLPTSRLNKINDNLA